ncbi:MAG: DUF4279 domain-containing protein [Clostridiales bacterium]|nr:DUF4279 domain-containing protein [Clostridiales bacterium]
MIDKTTCYTYFGIRGDFNPDDITNILRISPEHSFLKGELNEVGKPYKFSCWCGCYCRDYDIDLSVQMKKTIEPLLNKTEELESIRTKYGASLSLEVVPEIVWGSDKPIVAPSIEVMEFCCRTHTDLDIDWYFYVDDDYKE